MTGQSGSKAKKQLYTSYFARNGKHPNRLSISEHKPWFYKGPEFTLLAPEKDLLRRYKAGEIDDKQYTVEFLAYLRTLDVDVVVEALPDKAILLCWEGPGKFCHRHLVREWLVASGDVKMHELEKGEIVE